MSLSGRSEALTYHQGLPLPIIVRPLKSARRLRLRFDEARGLLKLTCPQRMSRRAALDWAVEQRAWVDAQLAMQVPGEPLVPGAMIPIEGRETRLSWSPEESRVPRLVERELRCGGPIASFERRVALFLKRLALDTLSREAAEIGAIAGISARSVAVGDAATRWGSCSSDRRIRFSWRLILAPPEARRYVVAHEVAHLAHLNHGAEFKQLEARLFGGDVAAARGLLWRVGPRLKRIGRGD